MDEKSELLATEFYKDIDSCEIAKTGSVPEIAEGIVMLSNLKRIVEEATMNEFADFCSRVPQLDIQQIIDVDDDALCLPWIGKSSSNNMDDLFFCNEEFSSHHMDNTNTKNNKNKNKHCWPVVTAAIEQLMTRPHKIYQQIVEKYCGKSNYDILQKMAFLVVGVGNAVGSHDTSNSPVLDIVRYLEMEGALVEKYDMFVEKYNKMPEMEHNSGRQRFDGILVMHPYNVSVWKKFKQTTFFCIH
jgi:UDP-N-acetyl-D-mannosaminuronate dehydrogenase